MREGRQVAREKSPFKIALDFASWFFGQQAKLSLRFREATIDGTGQAAGN